MHRAHGVLIAEQRVQPTSPAPGPAPRLRLLVELEPRGRVFFRNLTDLLLSRRVLPVFISARPAPFWNDVFVGSGTGWASFAESMLGHLLLIIVLVWSQSKVWAPVKLFQQQNAVNRSIAYTPPAQTFRAAESRALNVRTRTRVRHSSTLHAAAQRRAIAVRPEKKPGIVAPPDITQSTAQLPDLAGTRLVTPMVPFSATAEMRRNASAGTAGVVAPAPQVDQATSRRIAMPQASAVAPAPELGGPPVGRAVKTVGLRVVEPPPSVQNIGNAARVSRLSSLSGTGASVVQPAPSVQVAGRAGAARLGSMAGTGSQVVPPPPSLQGDGNATGTVHRGWRSPKGVGVVPPPPAVQASGGLSGSTRSIGGTSNSAASGLLSGDGSQVIPPPPSAERASGSDTHGRFSSLLGDGAQVVPPAPSVEGAGNSAVDGRLGSLTGNGTQIIPPHPSVGGAGESGSGRRTGLLTGGSSEIVPPAPSVEGGGSAYGRGRFGSLPGGGSQIVPLPPLVAGGGVSDLGAGGRGGALLGNGSPVVAPAASTSAAAVNNESKPTVEELPLGLLGLVFAPPGTSFFSNFEVFVAKRRVGGDQLQLIKLVYEFLPYQRRLSEYDLANSPARVVKLRVTLDSSCNETLGRIIALPTNPNLPSRKYPELPPELRSSELDTVLPCYRTNAEDFRKAMARAR